MDSAGKWSHFDYSLYFILITWWMEVAGNIGGPQSWTG